MGSSRVNSKYLRVVFAVGMNGTISYGGLHAHLRIALEVVFSKIMPSMWTLLAES